MSLRLFLQSFSVKFTKKFTKNLVRLTENYPTYMIKTNSFIESIKMEPLRKKQKLVLEECELLISINKKGECSFDVMSKVETVCKGRKLDHFACSESGDGSIETAGLVDDKVNDDKNVDDKKVNDDMVVDDKVVEDKNLNDDKNVGDKVDDDKVDDDEVDDNKSMSATNDDSVDQDKDNSDGDNGIPPTSKYVSLDCEFVGIMGDISALGRCSIIDYDENVICDIYAWPEQKITTYRTRYSGITKKDMKRAIPLESALSQISNIIKDKIVVGHGIHNDFRVLGFGHPHHMTRDTQKCKLLIDKVKQEKGGAVSLKNMAKKLLDKEIQKNTHCSVIDATVTMQLFKLVRVEWETKLLKDQEKKSKLPDDHDQPPGHMEVSMTTEQGKEVQDGTEINGGIKKYQKRKRKGKSSRNHFGQILAGSKNINDYFKDDINIMQNGHKKISEFLKKRFLESGPKANTLDKSDESASLGNDVVENGNIHTLRDGKKYETLNVCTANLAEPAVLRKRKCEVQTSKELNTRKRDCGFKTVDKVNLKTMYDKNIKQLFHDDFWNDMNSSADTDKSCDVALN
ncbi:interferon-stimulated 20 kDa exonuclease-like 2 [Ruditapes philippinarum]|uniref:interferon-stimulated 20 kDa exonuclease-like 2 n=1 Tax=Ruditapes philippinarum TaxID=129788 RepID=UPI00295B88FC|nr:interferon-stimulated 20 kDa exonuclease-like 2 [Ruditapes philippinarum]XP_060570867.1 interferon-stimulated 20 kDa exonuclease-like 2 [Ruditapes philippinarum]XP_060570868.1 interferon-stimulated 20 kDa exonuclease-like 2 [Ruditapes philippinarum]